MDDDDNLIILKNTERISRLLIGYGVISSILFTVTTLMIAMGFASSFQGSPLPSFQGIRNCHRGTVLQRVVPDPNDNTVQMLQYDDANVDDTAFCRLQSEPVDGTIISRGSGGGFFLPRRNILLSVVSVSSSTAFMMTFPREETDAVYAKDFLSNTSDTGSSVAGAFSASDLAKLLHNVPTFTIVDGTGVPFFVFGEDAKLTSYFFTSYEEADRILSMARQSSEKAIAETIAEIQERSRGRSHANNEAKRDGSYDDERTLINDVGSNPWKDARISVIPLDTAVTLASVASSNKGSGVHFQVAPSRQDIEDAMEVERIENLPEGKVPIFYFEQFDVPLNKLQVNNNQLMDYLPSNSIVTPLYFQKEQLISEWIRIYPTKAIPPVKTTDLFATLVEMVQPNSSKKEREELQKLVFIPPKSSARKAMDCVKNSQNEKPYRLDQRIIVM
jgi:hypothetical protein